MPAYTYRSTGAVADNTDSAPLSPGAPTGKTNGDLLLLSTGNRTATQSISALTGWTQLLAVTANGSIEIWARIADGTGDDTPSVDWSGTGDAYAWIDCFYGNVYTDLATIVHASNSENATNYTAPPVPTLTITDADVLLYVHGRKNKSATSDDATTITAPAEGSLVKSAQVIRTGAGSLAAATAYVQRTTASNYSGTNFTIDGTSESAAGNGVALALKTSAATAQGKRMLLLGVG